jgi:hypothetical protein
VSREPCADFPLPILLDGKREQGRVGKLEQGHTAGESEHLPIFRQLQYSVHPRHRFVHLGVACPRIVDLVAADEPQSEKGGMLSAAATRKIVLAPIVSERTR